ncbi:MAG TPA: zinc ribbon domain-containing protein [Zoogloea sp.]|uniref:FmdB family zinc ribbon protein n=1 Tax=Zoogloea sp. TaxID=49181 RepID=UPI002BF3B69D|nr:zinc ribbon domain-containing protein [Zoogloea sp.]HOB46134.1 zinc ribbon domain-containing protein [Zoogloea sp.]HQA10075.1 zinc ribbon domain-containing protein [Zoogloea sp.]HQE38983.1 zinc ribbon domain-containing protein [Zoogloea sp.]
MPIYDFHCLGCDRIFERIVRSDVLPACPYCASEQVEKLVSKPAAPGKSAAIMASARQRAAREGHLSNWESSPKTK